MPDDPTPEPSATTWTLRGPWVMSGVTRLEGPWQDGPMETVSLSSDTGARIVGLTREAGAQGWPLAPERGAEYEVTIRKIGPKAS